MSDAGFMYGDVIIDEEFVTRTAAMIDKATEDIGKQIDKYLKVIADVSQSAVYSGKTHDALEQFVTNSAELKGKVAEAGTMARIAFGEYLEAIKKADKYLYS